MAQLPIRALTLYKQGIGYFQRRGAIAETSISLVVPREATNDVLKSLNVVAHRGGPVLSVDYETPEDKATVLHALPIKLTERASLVDLLSSLRGSQVTLHLPNDGTATGRIIGLEASLDTSGQPVAVLLQQDTAVRVLPIRDLQEVTLMDDQAAMDVRYFLDVSHTEQARTQLTVRLPEGEHDLAISYLAPSPTWRISYRLVSIGPDRARFIGWGLFDNTLDEDLDNVALTLMSGRPISFEYALMESRTPSRPQVSDTDESLKSSSNPLLAESVRTISHDLRSPLGVIAGAADLLAEAGPLNNEQMKMLDMIKNGMQSLHRLTDNLLKYSNIRADRDIDPMTFYRSGPLGDLKVSGSYFMPVMMGNAEADYLIYPVQTPVSVRRGQSAMVVLVDAEVAFERLCVYNGSKMRNHPLLVWRLQNTTNVALEQGPVTVIDGERYLGEGLLRFTGLGDDIQIPYALEFGVVIAQSSRTQPRSIAGLELDRVQRKARVSYDQVTETEYRFTSHVSREITVLVEHRDPVSAAYVEMPTPVFAAGGHTRWPVIVPPNGEVTFTVRERETQISAEDLKAWKPEFADDLRAAGVLPERFDMLLQRLWAEKRQVAEAADQGKALQAEYEQVQARQEQLRKNLSALGDSEREAAIRNRILDDLEASEDRRRALEASMADLEQQGKAHQAEQQVILDQVFAES